MYVDPAPLEAVTVMVAPARITAAHIDNRSVVFAKWRHCRLPTHKWFLWHK